MINITIVQQKNTTNKNCKKLHNVLFNHQENYSAKFMKNNSINS